jgi:hypothetical protein
VMVVHDERDGLAERVPALVVEALGDRAVGHGAGAVTSRQPTAPAKRVGRVLASDILGPCELMDLGRGRLDGVPDEHDPGAVPGEGVDEPQRHRWPARERGGACAHHGGADHQVQLIDQTVGQ